MVMSLVEPPKKSDRDKRLGNIHMVVNTILGSGRQVGKSTALDMKFLLSEIASLETQLAETTALLAEMENKLDTVTKIVEKFQNG